MQKDTQQALQEVVQAMTKAGQVLVYQAKVLEKLANPVIIKKLDPLNQVQQDQLKQETREALRQDLQPDPPIKAAVQKALYQVEEGQVERAIATLENAIAANSAQVEKDLVAATKEQKKQGSQPVEPFPFTLPALDTAIQIHWKDGTEVIALVKRAEVTQQPDKDTGRGIVAIRGAVAPEFAEIIRTKYTDLMGGRVTVYSASGSLVLMQGQYVPVGLRANLDWDFRIVTGAGFDEISKARDSKYKEAQAQVRAAINAEQPQQETCPSCGKSGPALDEFLSPYNGKCINCQPKGKDQGQPVKPVETLKKDTQGFKKQVEPFLQGSIYLLLEAGQNCSPVFVLENVTMTMETHRKAIQVKAVLDGQFNQANRVHLPWDPELAKAWLRDALGVRVTVQDGTGNRIEGQLAWDTVTVSIRQGVSFDPDNGQLCFEIWEPVIRAGKPEENNGQGAQNLQGATVSHGKEEPE